MLSIGGRNSRVYSGTLLVEQQLIPVFLCPRWLDVGAAHLHHKRRQCSSRSHSTASTSSITHPDKSKDSISKNSTTVLRPKRESFVAGTFVPTPAATMAPIRPNEVKQWLEDLAITHEALNEIVSRPQTFSSRSESLFFLEDARMQLKQAIPISEEAIQRQVQMIAPKLAYLYLKIGQPNASIDLLQRLTTWTLSEEVKNQEIWKPVVSLAFSQEMFSVVVQMTELLTRHAGLSGAWMNLLRLQALLRMAELGKGRSKSIHKADSMWLDFERAGKPIPQVILIIILNSQVSRENLELIAKTLEAIKRYSNPLDVHAWKFLLQSSLRTRKSRKVIDLLSSSRSNSTLVAEELITHFAKERNVRMCVRVMRIFGIPTGSQKGTSVHVSPTLKMYEEMIVLFAQSSKPDLAIRFLNLALAARCMGDYTRTWTFIAFSLNAVGRVSDTLYIGTALAKSRLEHVYKNQTQCRIDAHTRVLIPGRRAYSLMLSSVTLFKDVSMIVPAARSILLEMFSRNLKTDKHIRRSLARIVIRLSRNTNWSHLATFFNRVQMLRDKQHNDESLIAGWNEFKEALHEVGVADYFTITIWKEMMKRKPHKSVTDATLLMLSNQLEAPKLIDCFPTFSSTSEGEFAPVKLPSLDLNRVLTPAGYAMRLRVYAVIRGDYEAANKIFHSMVQHGIQPSMHHVAPIVEGLVLNNRVADAMAIKNKALEELTEKRTHSRVFAALCRGLGQREDWQAVCDLAQEMQALGLRIDRSFQNYFRKAKRMLKQTTTASSANTTRRGEEVERAIGEMGSDKHADWSLEAVTNTFQDLLDSRQFFSAQQHVLKALHRKNFVSDGLLRKLLRKSENWLRKEIAYLKRRGHGSRKLHNKEQALRLCIQARAKARITPEQKQQAWMQRNREQAARRAMVNLVQNALGSQRLWEEAHSTHYRSTFTFTKQQ